MDCRKKVMPQHIVVTVFCAVYNHEPYLRQTLESIVSQKTDFSYEVIVHDDASTDNSRTIIAEFAEKYPQIIRPIYQTENQQSKGRYIIGDYMLPEARGEFFAWCEGDDYWTDTQKLQKQVDALRLNPDCSFCSHVVPISYEDTITGYFPAKKVITGVYSPESSLDFGYFQTSSFLLRGDKFRDYLRLKKREHSIWGSESILMYMKLIGNIYFINEKMSVYRVLTDGSWTATQKANIEMQITNRLRFIVMLEAFDRFSQKKYCTFFGRRINEDVLSYLALKDEKKRLLSSKYKFIQRYLTPKNKLKFNLWRLFPRVYEFLLNKMSRV